VNAGSASERALRLANAVCGLTGEPNHRGVLRLASRYLWRGRQREAAELGYLDLGDGG
jgi:hypothetical protein